jgi:hypothetical protein
VLKIIFLIYLLFIKYFHFYEVCVDLQPSLSRGSSQFVSWSFFLLEPFGPVKVCNGVALPLHIIGTPEIYISTYLMEYW